MRPNPFSTAGSLCCYVWLKKKKKRTKELSYSGEGFVFLEIVFTFSLLRKMSLLFVTDLTLTTDVRIPRQLTDRLIGFCRQNVKKTKGKRNIDVGDAGGRPDPVLTRCNRP